MARFAALYSGSSGNSTVIEEAGRYLLIDMGKSCRMTVSALKELGLQEKNPCAILVTHEHSDHIKGLAIYLKQHPVPVYGSKGTLDYLKMHNLVPDQARLIALEDGTAEIEGFHVSCFETSHDAAACRGYRVETPSGKVAALATDLGYVSDEVLANLLLADVVGLEANYDRAMLMAGPYPYYLKTRIASATGHLCNEECARTIVRLAKNGCRKFALCHISKENNTPELALEEVCASLKAADGVPENECCVQAAVRNGVSPVIEF